MTTVRFAPWWKTKSVILPVLVVAVLVAVLLVRSRDKTDPRVAATQVARYCDLARQFDDLSVTTGAASAPGEYSGSRRSYSTLLEQAGPMVEELESSAPKDIRSDVEVTVESLRKAASGDDQALLSTDFTEATKKTQDFRARSCLDAGTSGEG